MSRFSISHGEIAPNQKKSVSLHKDFNPFNTNN